MPARIWCLSLNLAFLFWVRCRHLCPPVNSENPQPVCRATLNTHVGLGSRFWTVWLGRTRAVRECTDPASVGRRGLPYQGGHRLRDARARRDGFPSKRVSDRTFTSAARLLVRVGYLPPYQNHVGLFTLCFLRGMPTSWCFFTFSKVIRKSCW